MSYQSTLRLGCLLKSD